MAPPSDLRDLIARLEREGELVRVAAEVDPDLEITEITDRTVKAGGPALLFENVKGSRHPLLINQFGTERRNWPPAARAPAAGTSACTGCRCSTSARRRCTGRSTRTAARTI